MEILSISYRDQFIRQAERLTQVFMDHTGLKKANILTPVAGNGNYLNQIKRYSFTIGGFDLFLERFSALWPDDLPWPDDIPRPPAERATFDTLPQADRDRVAELIAARKSTSATKKD
jgi:hypothetical protein